jgi:hypothetical protein
MAHERREHAQGQTGARINSKLQKLNQRTESERAVRESRPKHKTITSLLSIHPDHPWKRSVVTRGSKTDRQEPRTEPDGRQALAAPIGRRRAIANSVRRTPLRLLPTPTSGESREWGLDE